MTNLQGSAPNPWIARLLLWVPAGFGGLLALGVLALGTVPLISQLQMQGRQHEEKLALEERLPEIRRDLARIASQQQRAASQQQRVLQLIAGSGDLATFMAQADREARRHGVELNLYEPDAAAAEAAAEAEAKEADPLKPQDEGTRKKRKKKAKSRKQAEQAAKTNPLAEAGLSKTQLLLSAQGSYPNLLAFVRGLESLNLLVVQSNVTLSSDTTGKTDKGAAPAGPVQLKMTVTLYSQTSKT